MKSIIIEDIRMDIIVRYLTLIHVQTYYVVVCWIHF